MNKNVLIGIIALVVVGLAAGGYLMFTSSDESSETSETQNTESMMEDENSDESFSGTFLDLLALGQNYSCTFISTDEQGNQTEGKVYMASAGDRMNGEFTLTQEDGNTINSNVIRDGEYTYIWSSESEQGLKTKIDPEDESVFGTSEETDENSGGFNDQDEVDFECSPWSVDDSLFTPPTDIEFVDLSETMMQMQEASEDAQDAMEDAEIDCSVCDNVLEGEAKDQCLSSLGC